jgi:hypothetical protein
VRQGLQALIEAEEAASLHQRTDQRWGTATATVSGCWPHPPATASNPFPASGRAASSPPCWSPLAEWFGPYWPR